jgi:hypothetical protein
MKFKILLLLVVINAFGCSKDKSLDEFQTEELKAKIAKINAVSGTFSGPVISNLSDRSNLGVMTLNFKPVTKITNGPNNNSQLQATVSGTMNFKGPFNSEVFFDNGVFDVGSSSAGDLQIIVPIKIGSINANLSLSGSVNSDNWIANVEVMGQSDYGATIYFSKKFTQTNTPAFEAGGQRIQEIKKLNRTYAGTIPYNDLNIPVTLNFISREETPEQNLYKLFSPTRVTGIVVDFDGLVLNYDNGIIDDKSGTITGNSPKTIKGNVLIAPLNCSRYTGLEGVETLDCEIKIKNTTYSLHLLPRP